MEGSGRITTNLIKEQQVTYPFFSITIREQVGRVLVRDTDDLEMFGDSMSC